MAVSMVGALALVTEQLMVDVMVDQLETKLGRMMAALKGK